MNNVKKIQNRKKLKKAGVLFLALVLIFVAAACDQKNVEKPVLSDTREPAGTLDQTVTSDPVVETDPVDVSEPADASDPVDVSEPADATDPADASEPTDTDDPQVNKLPLFPSFTTKDLDGNTVSSDLFSENAVTVVNLWFTGCIYCVNEMPTLEQVYQSYGDEPVQFISICVDLGFAEGADVQARDIVESTGVTFPTLWPGDVDTEFGQFLYSIFAFPTTVIVNRRGELVGQPIEGAIMGESAENYLKGRINEVLAADIP